MVMTCSLSDLVVDTYDPSANMISILRKVLQIKKAWLLVLIQIWFRNRQVKSHWSEHVTLLLTA